MTCVEGMQSAPSQKGYVEHWNQRRWKNIRTLSETQSKTKVTRTRVTQGIRCHCGINNSTQRLLQ